MARIRSIKPELLEDEKTATLPHFEWRLFVSLLLLADDYGNFRASPARVAGAALWAHEDDVASAIDHLERVGLIRRYQVDGQAYAHIAGWEKHQKVDHPGKPSCPSPPAIHAKLSRNPREGLASDSRLIGSEGIGSEESPPAGAPACDPQSPPPAPEGITPFRQPARPLTLATKTIPFLDAFAPYPRKDAELKASQVFQEIAADYPGGEQALSAAILAAYARGILKRHPYNGPNAKRPYFETFLAERRWEDQASAPDSSSEASRCWFHQKPGTNGKKSSKPDKTCVECRHVEAGTTRREGEPTSPAAALPKFDPPPAWTAEQIAEAEALRKGTDPPSRAVAGGST